MRKFRLGYSLSPDGRQIHHTQFSSAGGKLGASIKYTGAAEKLGVSGRACFAMDTLEHSRTLSLFPSARSRRRTSPRTGPNPFRIRKMSSIALCASSALWIVAAFSAAHPASIVAQDAPVLLPASPALAAIGCSAELDSPSSDDSCRPPAPLIVIGFMGGHVRAGNLVHREAQLVRDLDRRYPNAVRAMTFANRDEGAALSSVLNLLDTDKNGQLSNNEKNAARIVLFGHSWGASEAVNLAGQLDRRGIPVLLTIQVDSVRKHGEHDGSIPANVREAINFYETEGMLHGRRSIHAIDPTRTTILGSYESTYKVAPVSCAGFPWFARTFMKQHIEIENDAAVWDRIDAQIDALIVARSCDANPGSMGRACGR
jgi:pimeloyl-ACP methyl ester carboxylesterase